MADYERVVGAEELFLSGGPLTDIEIGATGIRAVAQNVRCILATIKGELFLDRDFGVPAGIIDSPATQAQRLLAGIAAEVEYQEPRVEVVEIHLDNPGIADAADGRLCPRVRLRLREGVRL